jgi:poly(3-hydroxybutyrate) depolymerase
MLHGIGANAESARTFHAHNRFDALAERDQVIVVYGNAAPGSHTSPNPAFPNTGGWHQAIFDDGQVDDVEYLMKVIADLSARDVINGKNPVFLTGISNGGGMVLEAVRRMPDYFQGIAVFMPYDGEQPKPVPKTRIKRLLFAYAIDDPGMSDGYHEILAKQPALWAAAMGLPAAVILAPKQRALPDIVAEGASYHGDNKVALATRSSHVTEQDLIGPDGVTQVRVLVLEHAGHFWPNPIQDTQAWALNRWGLRNQDFDAADMAWEFLKPAASKQ